MASKSSNSSKSNPAGAAAVKAATAFLSSGSSSGKSSSSSKSTSGSSSSSSSKSSTSSATPIAGTPSVSFSTKPSESPASKATTPLPGTPKVTWSSSTVPQYIAAPAAKPSYEGGGVLSPITTSTEDVVPAAVNQAVIENYDTYLQAEADKYKTDAYRYANELNLQGTKYSADTEERWRNAIAKIEVEGKLKLQPIINAGLERVAQIQGGTSKAVGKMQLAGNMYGLISSVFG